MKRVYVFDSSKVEQKTFSQKVARFFELVGYITLIPSVILLAIILFFSAFYVLIYLLMGYWIILIYAVIGLMFLLTPYLLGALLIRGYFLHSRGRLSKDNLVSLWVGTIAYNLAAMLLILSWVGEKMPSLDLMSVDFWEDPINRIFMFIIAWFIAACALSVVCLFDDYSLKNSGNGL